MSADSNEDVGQEHWPSEAPSPFRHNQPLTRRTFLWTASTAGALLALRAAKVRAAALPKLPDPLTRPCLATSRTSYPPLLDRFISKLDPTADVFPTELYAAEIADVLDRWSNALRKSTRDTATIRASFSDTVSARSLSPSQTIPLRVQPPLRIERRIFEGNEIHGRDRCAANFHDYLSGWNTLETVELEIYGIRIVGESPLRVVTDIRCDLVGIDSQNKNATAREQCVGAWHIEWVREEHDGQSGWFVHSWDADAEIRSVLTGPGFIEITGQCLDMHGLGMAQLMPGIDHWRTALDGASGIDVYGNHGVAVGDIDGSGYDSFYVCQPSGLPNRLYRNRGDGTFDDITTLSGTGILDGTASALFVDFQNRGKQDLLVVRSGGPLLFANMGGGKFEPRPDAFQFARAPQGTFTSAAVADYNRDGLLDVYLCVYSYYQGLNQYQFPSPYYDAQNGPPNFLFRNRGDGTFEDVTAQSGMDQNNNRFSFAVAWCDYDNDGWPDLYVANDFGRKNLYRNNGDGTFTDVAEKAGVQDYGPGMSTCWIDYDNDGLQDVYVANMWLPEGKRITADERFLPGVDLAVRTLYQKHNAGNSLYRNTGRGAFEDKTVQAGSAMGRWSWSCASWDFDNDGWDDLYVANGFVSGPNHHDLQSFFWRQVAQRSMTPQGATADYEMAWNAVNELVRSDYSWSGYQRNAFFANNHDGTFSDVSGALGLDLIDDSRAYALSDFDHDGRLEFVLKNRTGPQLKLIRNSLANIGNSIIIRLMGHTSNRDAIGAVVTVEAGALRQTKFVAAGSGFASQHTKELSFGLGERSSPVAISIRWPNGDEAHYNSLPVNHRIQINEGVETYTSTPYKVASSYAIANESKALSSQCTISTWLVAPLIGPDLKLPDSTGTTKQLSELKGKPVLLTFVRADCSDSHAQLEQLQRASASLAAASISLYTVAIAPSNDPTVVKDLAKAAKVSFPLYLADEHAVGAWNIQYRYLYDRRRDMTLPISFLLDTSGAILRIYQGVVALEDVITDWKSAPKSDEERFARAMPFPGPYYGGGMKHDYLTFGIAFTEYGYVDEAQVAFQRAIDADPTHQSAWFNLGTIYLNKKMYPEARKYLTEAVRLNPQDSDGWNNLGMISGEEEKYDEALDEFRRAALANPNHLLATENMMRIYQYQGRAADAQKTLEELIAQAPENGDLHLGLAMTLVAQNDLKHAREELETAVRLKPNSPDAINNLGAVLLRLGLAADALAKFEESRRISPDFDRAVINCAIAYNRLGQPDKARDVLREFLEQHPENVDVRAALDKMGAR